MSSKKVFLVAVSLSLTLSGLAGAELVAHWKLDSNAVDSSPYGNDGTINGTPGWDTTEKIGHSLILDGDDYVEMDVTNYKGVLGTGSRTCSAWIKTTSVTGPAIMSWGLPGTSGAWWIFRLENTGAGGTAGALRVQVQDGAIVGDTAVNDGQWHHVAAVLQDDGSPNADEIKLYVDGVEETYSNIVDVPIDTVGDQDVMIGTVLVSGNPVIPFTGQIDDVRIYNEALSEDGIRFVMDPNGNTRIEVTKPAGGEVWAAGSSHTITWQKYGYEGNVNIFYSDDNGTGWVPVDTDIAGDAYVWTLPGVDSDQCIVSVAATVEPNDNEYVDSGVFTILPYAAGAEVSSKWPSLAKGADRNALSSEQGPELGCVKWQYSTPEPVYISTTVGANDQVHIACEDGKIYTIDPNTGGLLWSYDTGSTLLSAPSVGPDGTVYVGADNGKLYAIDKDGQLRWTHDTGGFVFSSAAVASDGKVYVGSVDGKLYALGPDGSELWSYEIDGPGEVPASILASPGIGGDGNIYIGGLYDSKMYALDAASGSVVWSCDFEHPDPSDPCSIISGSLFASPVVDANGIIYAGLLNDTSFYAIDPATGSILWSTELADTDSGAFDEYYSDPCDPGTLFYNVGDSCWSEPVIGPDGTIYVNLDDPYLRALDPVDGSIKWISRIGMVGGFTMAVGNDGFIYAASDDGGLHVINPAGEEVARFESGDWLSYPVIAGDGTVLLSDADNTVWAISADSCDSTTADLHRPADLTQDRTVSMPDFVMLAGVWLGCSDPGEYGDCNYAGDEIYLTGDVNIDMYIGMPDLKIMAQWWFDSE